MNAPRGAPEPTDAWTEFFAGACRPDDHCDDPDFLSQEGKANELADLLQHLGGPLAGANNFLRLCVMLEAPGDP